MESNRSIPDEGTRYALSDRVDSWIELFNSTPIIEPGVVLLVLGDGRALDGIVAAWHMAVANLVAEECEGKTAQRVFKRVEHILPQKLGKRDVLATIIVALQAQATSLGWREEHTRALLDTVIACQVPTNEGSDVITALSQVQDEAAVAISCAHAYRFSDIRPGRAPLIRTWSGIDYRLGTREQLYMAHLMELARQTLSVAKEKKLFVTMFCEEYGLVQSELPSDLQSHPDFVVLQGVVPSMAYESLSRLQDWLSKVEELGIDLVLAQVAETVDKPEDRALLTSHLLFANQQFAAAWATVEPYLETLADSDGALLLLLSQTAMAAGRKSEGRTLLEAAIDRGLDLLEDLNSAYVVAEKLGLEQVSSGLLARMRSEYPNSGITLSLLYQESSQARNFSGALEIAQRLGDPFRISLCRALASPEFDMMDFLASAEKMGKLDNAYVVAALEAEQRGEHLLAREWASKIDVTSEFSSAAVQIRTRVIGRIVRSDRELADSEARELEQVMSYSASHPSDLDVRLEVESLLDSGLEQPASAVLLSTILLNAAGRSFAENAPGASPLQTSRTHTPNGSGAEGEEVFARFWEEFVLSLPQAGFILGQGTIPHSLKRWISPSVLYTLLLVIQEGSSITSDDDVHFLHLAVHASVLLSRELADPSSDFTATRIVIGQLANAGFAQEARDLAETSLVAFPGMQPDYGDWRTGQGWACCADAFHRTGNTMAALRCLCLSFLSWDGTAVDWGLLNALYRLAARVFRDLGFMEFALEMVALERTLRVMTDSDDPLLWQLDEVELSIQIARLGVDAAPELVLALLRDATNLLSESENEEIEPLLACQANLIRFLKLEGAEIPPHIEEEFNQRLERTNESMRRMLSSVVITTPSRNDLLSAIQSVASANSLDDLAHQIGPIHSLAMAALLFACQQEDIELFVLASTLLSQPVLSLRTLEASHVFAPLDSGSVQKWWFQLAAESGHDVAKVMDARRVVENVAPALGKSFAELGSVSLSQLQSAMKPCEAAMLLVRGPDGGLCRAVIYAEKHLGPERLSEDKWSPVKYREWTRFFPSAYGDWEPASDPFAEEEPSTEAVRHSVAPLTLGDFKLPESLYVIPDPQLFGFPFNLTPKGESYLGVDIQVATVPSVPWLVGTRSEPWRGDLSRKAWLGSPATDDWTLHYLRDRLVPCLKDHEFEVVESGFPRDMAHTRLVLIVSHGRLGLLDHLRTVTDATTAYSTAEFASKLEGCGCVVLFVCSAGRSDPQLGSLETLGLVSELVRAGVRTVIAPPWPLHIYVAETWLPPFLENLSAGQSAGYAARVASGKVRDRYANPCAWGALQVYGDASLLLA